jgi:hypothetical protein
MKTYGGSGGIASSFLTLALDGGEWSVSRLVALPPGKQLPRVHCTGGWVGTWACLYDVELKKKTNHLLCFHYEDTDRTDKTAASDSFSIVACVFIITETCFPSRCLTTVGGIQ